MSLDASMPPLLKEQIKSLLVRYPLTLLLRCRRFLVRRRRWLALLLFALVSCSTLFQWVVFRPQPQLRRSVAVSTTSRTTVDWRTRGVITEALRRGDLVMRPAIARGSGLGNQMFNWASTRSLAGRLVERLPAGRRLVVVVPSDSKVFTVFGKQLDGVPVTQEELDAYKWHEINESNIVFDTTLEKRLITAVADAFSGERTTERPPPSLQVASGDIRNGTSAMRPPANQHLLLVRSYMQSFRYFERPRERRAVLRQFAFPDLLRNSTNALIAQIQSAVRGRYASPAFDFWRKSTLTFALNESATLTVKRPLQGTDEIIYVAVHMRLGDYHENIQNIIAGPTYFLTAAAHFLSHYKYVHFIVASDGPEEVERLFPRELRPISSFVARFRQRLVEPFQYAPSAVKDLALLALCCHHTVFTVGSFGWWTAFLGDALRPNPPDPPSRPAPQAAEGQLEMEMSSTEYRRVTFYQEGFCEVNTLCYHEYYELADLRFYYPPHWRPIRYWRPTENRQTSRVPSLPHHHNE